MNLNAFALIHIKIASEMRPKSVHKFTGKGKGNKFHFKKKSTYFHSYKKQWYIFEHRVDPRSRKKKVN